MRTIQKEMKHLLANLGAPIAAFIIGITINNACADNLTKTSDGGLQSDIDLRNLVAELQKEVNSLNNRVSELEQKAEKNDGKATTGGYAFEVDGLHFAMNGRCCDPIKSYTIERQLLNDGEEAQNGSGSFEYNYDSYGRLVSSITKSYSDTTGSSYRYSYTDKTVIEYYVANMSRLEQRVTTTTHYE